MLRSTIYSLLLVLALPALAFARLGESESDCNTRYGGPLTDKITLMREKSSPLVEGLRCRTYEYQGWRLRAAFAEFPGPAVRIEYRKSGKDGGFQIRDYEIEAILKAECNESQTWKPAVYSNPNSPNTGLAKFFENIGSNTMGAAAWQRSDGVIATLDVTKMALILETPEVRVYEQKLKQDKEAQKKASVPQF